MNAPSDNQLIPQDRNRDLAEIAKRRAAAPLKPVKPQERCDIGLFGDTAAQIDLIDVTRRMKP